MISGLSHITLIVKDLNKTTTFLREIFNAEEIYSSGDQTFSLSKEKFFLIAGLWICIMEGDSLQEQTYNHIAFRIQSEEVDEYIERIKSLGVEMKPERPRVEGEGHSIYFYDFDNHLFELHSGTLEERLKRYHE
ncbi:FosX/FosE/FosI family fosfomycin resistance thiol transferase [Listeria monocytogenes]|uniref:FosX/FosE/FosI family fosfomycin resistance thiol transferase n=1 Tax=Listeria monocytogenes TaxID=1639 RepID=A0AAN3BLV6_LISMN|nr:fosfomycin resistance hydrolase FosX [Listeria monocytogenes]EAA0013822.1 FosX/FosE/FosI family fosfomycin resistance thiol transferase [Listeria monocytogenes]EAA0013995.1 FosX/FosE/FosI family fosfomycin resistance thiol transferase [Listeria monocytogenes]EAA0019613.1 FosX/FosE/FosI family fosfomycin resistance thiol transferase [Listeria monocytogenes]EAA0019670.1 FosX/FosE/FosI family fosfomycin resistance thiol transferase [Listeria monocytogenes]EAA0022490.1 FosX/FosE/FosI family fos